jgi:chemotaxis protein histidine kinase CheA
MVSSGTILGDGKVGLILDTRALLENSKIIEQNYISQNEEEIWKQ